MTNVLIPRVTTMVAKEESDERLTDLFIKVGRLQFCIIGLIVSGFAVFGQAFIRIWVGDSFANSYWVAVLTMFPLCVPLIQNTGLSIITAKNKHRFRSVVYLVIAIVNVISTYLVIPKYGVIGAAFCSGVSYIVGQGIIMNMYYWKVIHINIPEFWRNILRMSVIPAGMLCAGLVLKNFITLWAWLPFFALVFLYTAVYIVLMYRYSLNGYERDIFRGLVLRKRV
jgi:O-antigen/teichoic acid export membrane protein